MSTESSASAFSVDIAFLQAAAQYLPATYFRTVTVHKAFPPAAVSRRIRNFVFKKTSRVLSNTDIFYRIRLLRKQGEQFEEKQRFPKDFSCSGQDDNPPIDLNRDELSYRRVGPANAASFPLPQTNCVPGTVKNQEKVHGTSSMSKRRLSSNIPVLQRHLSLNNDELSNPCVLPFAHLSLQDCITPLDQVIRTPSKPPSLTRHDPVATPTQKSQLRRGSSLFSSDSNFSCSVSCDSPCPSLPAIHPLEDLTQDIGRRLCLSSYENMRPQMAHRASHPIQSSPLTFSPMSSHLQDIEGGPLASPFLTDNLSDRFSSSIFFLPTPIAIKSVH